MTEAELDRRLKEFWQVIQASGPDSRAAKECLVRHSHCAAFARSAAMLRSIARRVQSPRPG